MPFKVISQKLWTNPISERNMAAHHLTAVKNPCKKLIQGLPAAKLELGVSFVLSTNTC